VSKSLRIPLLEEMSKNMPSISIRLQRLAFKNSPSCSATVSMPSPRIDAADMSAKCLIFWSEQAFIRSQFQSLSSNVFLERRQHPIMPLADSEALTSRAKRECGFLQFSHVFCVEAPTY
jgi:hypothetical protein